jgi:LysM repeat protein
MFSKGRHRRPSRTAGIVTGTAGASLAGAAIITAAPAAHAATLPLPAETVQASVRATAIRIAQPLTVTVRSGDTLSKIAQDRCGNPADWTGIDAANRGKIKDYNEIYPGQVFVLACKTASVPVETVVTSAVTPHHVYQAPASSSGHHYVSVSGGNLSFAGLENLWVSAGGPGWAQSSAAAVAECESGGRQYAYNPSGASGYWQILGEVVPGNVFDPMTNARNAVAKFEASGDTWAQWVCKP